RTGRHLYGFTPRMKNVALFFGFLLVATLYPACAAAQLVRENTTAPPQQASPKQDAQNSSTLPPPSGKKRLSQEIQLTGEESWLDTSIDIQAGEHVFITATGN